MNTIARPLLIAVSAALCLECCAKTPEIPLTRHDCVEIPSVTPADLLNWPAAMFVFDGKDCTYEKEAEALCEIGEFRGNEGDRVVTVAWKNGSAASLSWAGEGRQPGDCRLKVLPSEECPVPEIWSCSSVMEDASGILSQVLSPVTSKVRMETLDKDGGKVSVTLKVPGGADTFGLDGSFTAESELPDAVLVPGKEVIVMPAADDGGEWIPAFVIKKDGKKLRPAMQSPITIGKGQDIAFTADFRKFDEGEYSISWKISDIFSGKQISSGSRSFDAASGSAGSDMYSVSVLTPAGWEEMDVHRTLCSDATKHGQIWNDWSNSKALRDTMSYCIVQNSFESPLKVRVKKLRGTFSSAEVRPSVYGIAAEHVGDGTVEFSIPSADMRKVSVEFDGDRQNNLFIYGVLPDTGKPDRNAPGVIWYGPGEHDAGTIELGEGQTLYIDYGAKVFGNVKASGRNITIAGNGILSGEKMSHYGDNLYSWGDFLVECRSTDNLKVRNVTLIDGPGWNMIVRSCRDVTIHGINTISWELNGDGIDIVSCTDVDIRECFLRNYDDCITLKCRFIVSPITDVSGVTISKCLIWNDFARGIVIGPEAGNINSPGRIHDIEVEGCIFLQHAWGEDSDLRAAFAIGQGTDGKTDLWNGTPAPTGISGIKVRDLVFDNISANGRNIAIWQYGGKDKAVMDDVLFENITVLDGNQSRFPAFTIRTNGSSIDGLTIRGFTVDGKKIEGKCGDFVIDVENNVKYRFE